MSKFNWEQPHPQFEARMKAAKIAELKLTVAQFELSAVCAHKYPNSTSFSECSVCGANDRTTREQDAAAAVSARKRLAELLASPKRSYKKSEPEFDPLIRGGKDDR